MLAHELTTIRHLRHFFVENEKPARRLLKRLLPEVSQSEFQLCEIGKHADESAAFTQLRSWSKQHDRGLISDCGAPAVADPGSAIVARAHQAGMLVIPLVGPSSILLTLMASGFSGQSFVFHGYLPIDAGQRLKFLQKMEADSQKLRQTQLFMETPFRNNALLEQLQKALKPDTLLCIGSGIHTPQQFFKTDSMAAWKTQMPDIHKIPAIFAIFR